MGMIEELKELGVRADEGIDRFGGDADLYVELMEDVVAEIEAHEVLSCFESGDLDTALANAHCLKGALGNMCISPLYEDYEAIVRNLRNKNRSLVIMPMLSTNVTA